MSKRTSRSGARPSRALQVDPHQGDPDAAAAGHRHERLEHILLEELRTIVCEAADPALAGIRLLSVHLTPDGALARVAYAMEAPLEAQADVQAASEHALSRARGFLRARLGSLLELKRLPRLSFAFVGVQEPGAQAGGASWRG